MILIGPMPASLDDVTDAWAAEPVAAWVTSDGPVMMPRVRSTTDEPVTGTEARAFVGSLAWAAVRAERDRRLTASDFRMVTDAPWDTAPWAAYRQALRDLPENTADPLNPIWPEVPA